MSQAPDGVPAQGVSLWRGTGMYLRPRSLLVLLGVALVAGDLALELRRVVSCDSVLTSRCVGGFGAHLLLLVGLALILVGWSLLVAEAGHARPLALGTVVFAVVVVPVLATIGFFVGDDTLNPSDGAWDGRPLAIRLSLMVLAPASVALAACALNRCRLVTGLAVTVASVTISYALPFAVAIVLTLLFA